MDEIAEASKQDSKAGSFDCKSHIPATAPRWPIERSLWINHTYIIYLFTCVYISQGQLTVLACDTFVARDAFTHETTDIIYASATISTRLVYAVVYVCKYVSKLFIETSFLSDFTKYHTDGLSLELYCIFGLLRWNGFQLRTISCFCCIIVI